ncbi:GNAT family N-acetyltransferase [Micromonospora sp. WMMD882]|uniref:GNAT family N-acetyltransferase n=1 Tax=Micromonospora sp. WMMD882 TaxID=3015151 RepID=UPI00248C0C0B|nr:GNAT family N-acetyltransferase [Micromonospora sp. WMMD882]WBB78036.1 GNAT family N-acetyltransferase [Micromonospora sp. WMMD882]
MAIRHLAVEEILTTAYPLRAYAFGGSPGPVDLDELRRTWLPYQEGNRTLVAETADGVAMATATGIPMRQNLRGRVLPMAGVASVTTHPLGRRQGHVRELLQRLLDEMRDEGHLLSTLYPFRPSFYERFGYVGLAAARTATFPVADLAALLRADLPGEVRWTRAGPGYPEYVAFLDRCLTGRHGFAVFPGYRQVRVRDDDDRWLLTAHVDGVTEGLLTYRIDDHGGTLAADDLLAFGPLARTLLLQFLGRHVDQVERVSMVVAADDLPELWLTDLGVVCETRVTRPDHAAPMARLLSMDALDGLPAGAGRCRVELTTDRWLAGTWLLDGATGHLESRPHSTGDSALPVATLTAAGLSALAYGVLDPAELVIRGLGVVPPDAAVELRRIFPRDLPYLHANF